MEITKETVLRAWKDEQYRASLPEDVRSGIPEKPVQEDGAELSDDQLDGAAGGIIGAIAAGVAGAGALYAGSAAVSYAISDSVDGDC